MTRETKIGLLISVGIILLVAIVVSDHLSTARNPGGANLTDWAAQTQQSLGGGSGQLTDPFTRSGGVSPRVEPIPLPRETLVLPDERSPQVAMVEPTPSALASRGGFERLIEPAPTLQRSSDGLLVPPMTLRVEERAIAPVIVTSTTPPAPPAPVQAIIHVVKDRESLYGIANQYYGNGEYWRSIRDANPGLVGSNGTIQVGSRLVIPNKDGQANSGKSPATAATRGNERVIVVQPGQTLSELAREHLGSSSRWQELMAANRDQLRMPQQLQAGMKLRIPEQAGREPGREATSPSRDELRAPAGPAVSAMTYVVKPGDSLSSIAAVTLGDTGAWERIFDANRQQLADPDSIAVGMKLRIPARP